MELIDQIMFQINDYVTDPMAVSNCLYIAMQDYSITKKSTELIEYVPDSNVVLIKKFLVVKKIKGCTDRTLNYYGKQLPKILDRIGKNVIDIKVDDIRLWIALRIRDGVSATTIGNEKRVLSSFFTWLHGEDIIHKNPKVDFKEPNKIELRERVPEPVNFETTRKDKYLLGCLYAISRLLDDGSSSFATKIDGKWETIPWKEICEWIDAQMEGE